MVSHLFDIFALGIVFYEWATGRHLFQAETMIGYLHTITLQTPAPPPHWEAAFWRWRGELLWMAGAAEVSQVTRQLGHTRQPQGADKRHAVVFKLPEKKFCPHGGFSLFRTPLEVAATMRLENKEENVMKNLFTAVILGIALAGVSLAQISSEEKTAARRASNAAEVKVAVVEFSLESKASEMPPEAKRQLQTNLAAALAKSDKFDIADIRWTQNASQGDLAAINGGASTAAAVKLGKLLGVSYVLTGTVVEYTPKGEDGLGRVILKTRLIEVATGKIKHTGETTQLGTSAITPLGLNAMKTTGAAEMHMKVMKPAIEKLKQTLLGLRL